MIDIIATKREARAFEPLVALTLIAALAAQILAHSYAVPFFHSFAGLWLLEIAAIKLFDIDEFAGKFAQYDFLALRSRPYAYVYPFIQLALGLAFIGGWHPLLTATVLLLVALVTLIGMFIKHENHALFTGHSFGNTIRVRLSDTAIIENTFMILMALSYFLTHKIIFGDLAFTPA